MLCPTCGKRPLSFGEFMTTLNPLRIVCRHCSARLRAGPIPYVWILLHGVLAVGLVEGRAWLRSVGMLNDAIFLLAALALFFCTAFVIPWVWLDRAYRAEL
jgi:hypothetical protein